jgi:plastocyanin
MTRTAPLLVPFLLLGLLSAAPKPADHEVAIRDLHYEPAELKVKEGETVRWTNDDDRDHTVVSRDKESKFKSPVLHQGDSWTLTFDKPGRFRYGCRFHPRMRGTVIVTEK